MKNKSYSITLFLVISLILSLAVPPVIAGPDGHGASAGKIRHGGGTVKVMTMNIYVGADVDQILEATDVSQIPALVLSTYLQLSETKFEERAEAIARKIARERPHLIGLQEVSFITCIRGAEVEVTDYLSILMEALSRHHANYRVAGQVENVVIVLPTSDPSICQFVGLIDSDVVLARGDVKISDTNKLEQNYDTSLFIPDLGITIPRGYVAVDATINKRTYRFVNTHLEPIIPELSEPNITLAVQLAQAGELITQLADEDKPVIVVGDFNSQAPSSQAPVGGDTYNLFLADGYIDVWTRNLKGNEGEGFTFGHAPLLNNPVSNLDERIDLIFVRNEPWGIPSLGPVIATVWGDALRDRTTPSELWPSDHAATIARMRIPVFSSVAYSE